MIDYSVQLEAFEDSQIRLPSVLKKRLYAHRDANRDRLIARLPKSIAGLKLDENNFKPQGSVAIDTIIQTIFTEEEYDIDIGVVVPAGQLVEAGRTLSVGDVRERLRKALEDGRFKRQPVLMTNCARVFYADEDAEKHHVDVPIYRKRTTAEGSTVRELAGESGWIESNPTQVSTWFRDEIARRNNAVPDSGGQLRQLVRLLKRFARSRKEWLDLLPNGMKLTMLAVECAPAFDRLDIAFRNLLEAIGMRLATNCEILNLAHEDKPPITRTKNDPNVLQLKGKVSAALDRLRTLDAPATGGAAETRQAWEWILQPGDFFSSVEKAISRTDSVAVVAEEVELDTDVPWRQPLPWPERLAYQAGVKGQKKGRNGGWYGFASGEKLDKSESLRFVPSTSAPTPHEFYWQVVNTGSEAGTAKCLRGEILEPSDNRADGIREESTGYTGRHWVECFVVRGGVCVARSGPFVVAVR